MGRLLESLIRIRGELVARTPVHCGGLGEDVFSDLPLAVNGEGKVYFPGSGIAGVLRGWCQDVCPDLASGVWGDEGASLLFVEDAPLLGSIDLDIAQHVAIDRYTGTAAANRKFDRQVVPIGSRFRLFLELQRPADKYWPGKLCARDWDRIKSLLRRLLEDLAAGHIRFGADKSRGRGKFQLDNLQLTSRDLASGILDTLASRDDRNGAYRSIDAFFNGVNPIVPSSRPLKITITCKPVTPVMQRHEAEGTAVDMLPAIALEGDKRKPFLAGTGIKGAFRAQSERILRTVLEDGASLALASALYGESPAKSSAKENRSDERETVAPSNARYFRPGQGAVTFDDCLFDHPLSHDEWRCLLTFAPQNSEERLAAFSKEKNKTCWSVFHPAALVAIDRWTGGAADRFLFSRLEPSLDSFKLSATIDPARIAPPPGFWNALDALGDRANADQDDLLSFRRAALALFLLTLRDFARGRIPLGYGVNRGLGDVEMTEVVLSGTVAGVNLKNLSLKSDDFDDPDKMAPFQTLQEDWTAYLGWVQYLLERGHSEATEGELA